MGKKLKSLSSSLIQFIEQQKVFFVGTAMQDGYINVSPKGLDTLRVVDENRVVWLNLTGSGNETAAHLSKLPRMTIMFCSFDQKPLILRIYGEAHVHYEGEEEYERFKRLFPNYLGTRQLVSMRIDLVQTSCGFGVPVANELIERPLLNDWASKKGKEGIREYWQEKNTTSLDGHPIHMHK